MCWAADGVGRASYGRARIGVCMIRKKQSQIFQCVRIPAREHDGDLQVAVWITSHLLSQRMKMNVNNKENSKNNIS